MRRAALLTLSLLLGGVGTAAAGSWTTPGYPGTGVCGGDNFFTCMSASVTWDGTNIWVKVYNHGTSGEAFKTIALAGLPSGQTFGFVSTTVGSSGAYVLGMVSGTAGPGPNRKYGIEAVAPPTSNSLRPGQWGEWKFSYNTFSDAELNAAYVVVHAIDGDRPNDQNCSTWFWANANGAASVPQGDKWELCNQTVIPEPGSMVLLATGLVGLVGAGVVRQRKRV